MSVIEAQKSVLEKKIMEKARAAYDGALKKAAEGAAHLIEKTKDKEEERMSAAVDEAAAKAESFERENKANSELEAKLFLLKAKDALVNRVFFRMWEELKTFSQKEDYRGVISGLIEEGAAGMKSEKIIVTAGEAEKKVLTDKTLKEIKDNLKKSLASEIKFTVTPEMLPYPGGVVLSNEEGTLIYDNSWQARFERMKKELYIKVSEIIFK